MLWQHVRVLDQKCRHELIKWWPVKSIWRLRNQTPTNSYLPVQNLFIHEYICCRGHVWPDSRLAAHLTQNNNLWAAWPGWYCRLYCAWFSLQAGIHFTLPNLKQQTTQSVNFVSQGLWVQVTCLLRMAWASEWNPLIRTGQHFEQTNLSSWVHIVCETCGLPNFWLEVEYRCHAFRAAGGDSRLQETVAPEVCNVGWFFLGPCFQWFWWQDSVPSISSFERIESGTSQAHGIGKCGSRYLILGWSRRSLDDSVSKTPISKYQVAKARFTPERQFLPFWCRNILVANMNENKWSSRGV